MHGQLVIFIRNVHYLKLPPTNGLACEDKSLLATAKKNIGSISFWRTEGYVVDVDIPNVEAIISLTCVTFCTWRE